MLTKQEKIDFIVQQTTRNYLEWGMEMSPDKQERMRELLTMRFDQPRIDKRDTALTQEKRRQADKRWRQRNQEYVKEYNRKRKAKRAELNAW